MKAKVFAVLAVFLIALFSTSCGKDNSVDMQKFIDKAQKEKQQVSPEKKKEIRKSVFPNIKEKEN